MAEIPENTIEKMRDALDKARKTNKEHGFFLCLEKHTQNIVPGPLCVGRKCEVALTGPCKPNIYIGNFHTHIKRERLILSASDLLGICNDDRDKLICIGNIWKNKVICFTKKGKDCRKDASKLFSRQEILNNKFDKTEISKVKYNKELDKLFEDIDRTTKRYFNEYENRCMKNVKENLQIASNTR